MKLILKSIQENGVIFGMAEAVKRDLRSNLKHHDFVRGMTFDNASKALCKRGFTDYQIDLIYNAVWEEPRSHRLKGKLKINNVVNKSSDGRWITELNAGYELKSLGITYQLEPGETYYLTEDGVELWRALRASKRPEPVTKDSSVPHYLDLNLSRDGLVGTCKKISWLLRNREAVQTYRTEVFLQNLQTDQKLLDNTLNLIATSEQRVARRLIEQGPKAVKSSWTEEQQRAQNDLYWITDSLSAFWLNPAGVLADPTPAPEWWSPPENYESATQKFISSLAYDDVVAKSLQAPPGMATKRSKGEILNEVIADLEELSKKADSYQVWKQKLYPNLRTKTVGEDLIVVEAGGVQHWFSSRAEADAFTRDYQNKIRNKKTRKEYNYNTCKEYPYTASTNTKEMYYTGVILPSNRGD